MKTIKELHAEYIAAHQAMHDARKALINARVAAFPHKVGDVIEEVENHFSHGLFRIEKIAADEESAWPIGVKVVGKKVGTRTHNLYGHMAYDEEDKQ